MKDGAVVVLVVDVLQKVFDGDRCLGRIELEHDLAFAGLDEHLRIGLCGRAFGDGQGKEQGADEGQGFGHDGDS